MNGYWAAAIAVVIWASYPVATRAGVTGSFAPQDLVTLRFGVGALLFLPYLVVQWRHIGRAAWLQGVPLTLFQGAGMWTVSLPVQAAAGLPGPSGLTPLDLAGLSLWLVGMTFEVVGDLQLTRFRADPANRGRVMDRGLWRYTRHPNYFGDLCVWWALFLIALAADDAWWAIAGPLTMTAVFSKFFGVPMMERHLAAAKPGYGEYVRRTSAFFPCPPRAG